MADLVDYLRDKLAHADDPVCSCRWADVTMAGDTPGWTYEVLATVEPCPAHPEPRHTQRVRTPGSAVWSWRR